MSSSMNQIASDLYKSLTESNNRKPKPYDTKAEVLREDGNTVWVKIPGGIDETPVQKTNNAKPGDTVIVRVSGGRAWLLGNNTSPATDDTRANQAYQVGSDAGAVADLAIKEASRAQEAANLAEAEAERAHTAADHADEEAGRAKSAADDAMASSIAANIASNSALTQLSVVEDVASVLTWISEHGTYKASTDTSVISGKLYFTKNGNEYNLITEPTGNPSTSGYYEIDTIGDETVANYISSHLALTNAGLWVVKDNASYKILLSANGMMVYDANGNLVSTFGQSVIFSDTHAQYIGGENAYIRFDPSNGGSITIGGSNITLGSNKPLSELLAEVDGTLIFDTTYTVSNGIATFTAHVYRGGVDIAQTKYSATDFSWSLKRELSEAEALLYPEGYIPQGTGYTKTFNIADCGYGAEVIATFIPPEDAELLNQEGDNLTTSEDENLIVRATGNSVRVRDLEVSTTIYATDKLMAVGDTDEHLVTADTLYQYLLTRLEQETLTLYCGTATELVG